MEIDKLGTVSKEVDVEEFKQFYNKNKQQMDKVCSRTLNKRFILKDSQGNRYKVIRRKGKTRAIRVSERDTSKNTLVRRIDELTQRINMIETNTDAESNNNTARSNEFEHSLYRSIQNQTETRKQKI